MVLLPNNWNRIRAFYEMHGHLILRGAANEWAIDPYAWEQCGGINMTPIEAWLWADIRSCNAIFYPQYPVGRFFVDFANPVARVAIECDGYAYHLDHAKDRARDEELATLGWVVYRVPGHVCATEEDEETGEPGRAQRFVSEIVEAHRLGRHHQWTYGRLQAGDAGALHGAGGARPGLCAMGGRMVRGERALGAGQPRPEGAAGGGAC